MIIATESVGKSCTTQHYVFPGTCLLQKVSYLVLYIMISASRYKNTANEGAVSNND